MPLRPPRPPNDVPPDPAIYRGVRTLTRGPTGVQSRGAASIGPFLLQDLPMEDFEETVKEIAAAPSPDALEAIRIRLLGRRGSLTLAMRELGAIDPDERRRVGAELNTAKERITAALTEATARLDRAELAERLAGERADGTLPIMVS